MFAVTQWMNFTASAESEPSSANGIKAEVGRFWRFIIPPPKYTQVKEAVQPKKINSCDQKHKKNVAVKTNKASTD